MVFFVKLVSEQTLDPTQIYTVLFKVITFTYNLYLNIAWQFSTVGLVVWKIIDGQRNSDITFMKSLMLMVQ